MRLLVSLLPCIALSCQPPPERAFDAPRAFQYLEQQMAFGPRIPGTAGHVATGDWILEQLQRTADTVIVQAFEHVTEEGDTLALRNFIGRFNPTAERRILYVAHWDTRPQSDQARNLGDQQRPVPGANDGASGVALLLGVADVLDSIPSEHGVDLLFVDGEDYGDFGADQDVFLGSRYYAANLLPGPLPEFAVVFDMVGDADLRIFREGYSVLGAPEVVERVWETAARIGHGNVFRDGPGDTVRDDHLPLQQVGIKAIDIIDFDYPYWHTPDDTIDKVSAESLQVVGDVALALLR